MHRPAISLALVLSLAACGGGGPPTRPAALVTVGQAKPHIFSQSVQAVGTALGNEQVSLTAPVTERITRINFADGGYVRAGQVIAELSQGQEAAALASAHATELNAQQQLQRIQALKDRGFATKSSLDSQTALYNSARASAAQAQAQIGDRVVRAPFSGYVSLRTISPGAVVGQGTEIAVVSDISRIKLDFPVPESDLGLLRPGQSVEAIAAAFPDTPFHGRIETIDPVVDPVSRSAKVRAILPNGDKRLKPGMLLTIRVIQHSTTSPAVPELAIVGEGDKRFVYVPTPEKKAKRVEVKVGARENGMVQILEGLNPNQPVITEGVVKLSDKARYCTSPKECRPGKAGARPDRTPG